MPDLQLRPALPGLDDADLEPADDLGRPDRDPLLRALDHEVHRPVVDGADAQPLPAGSTRAAVRTEVTAREGTAGQYAAPGPSAWRNGHGAAGHRPWSGGGARRIVRGHAG